MSSKDEKDTSRRAFFQDVTAGAAGIAVVSALAQMGANVIAAPQEAKPPTTGSAPYTGSGGGTGTGPAKQAASPFFKDPPPWPKGTDGHLYDHLFSTKLRENSMLPDIVPGPQAYFRGDSDLPGAKINMGWQIFVKPYKLELESHHHDTDEYLFFLGSTFPDLVGSFDAEIEYFMGKEYERHVITQATVLYIPAGVEHNPCNIRRVGKPLFFTALALAPYFNGVYQTMGYREFRGTAKIK
jgi:mannose-6-phosphate isomerase-like protein (cupin superfamily)